MNALIRKMARLAKLSDGEIDALNRLCSPIERRRRGSDLVREGERPGVNQLLLSGWGFRYKMTEEGKRQIVAYLLPGDICDLHITLLGEMDHSIGLLTDAEVSTVGATDLEELMEAFPRIRWAFWRNSLIDQAILREWLTNNGRRDAYTRMGHHLCELWHRMRSIGLVDLQDEFDMPLTQEEIGDALSLTSVHVNRTLKAFRDEGLITIKQKRLTLLDPERLAQITGFDPAYLHLKAREPEDAVGAMAD